MTQPGGQQAALPDLMDEVKKILERVLMVDPEDLAPEAELVRDLGAESIDFVDLIFQLEDLTARRVTAEDWDGWIKARLPNPEKGEGITVSVVHEFAQYLTVHPSQEL